jgi:hypothetical protein
MIAEEVEMKKSLGAKTLVFPAPTWIVGTYDKDVKADEAVLGAAGQPEIDKVRPIIFSPANRVYYGAGPSLGHAFAIGKEI